jgi:alpha-D-ribose 1-methylphosphonate 5-triphosphate diphosphatase
MKEEKVFTNGKVVTRKEVFSGTVQVVEGIIQAVDSAMSRLPSCVDLEGDYLLPGLIELHTDSLERHFVPRPGVRWPEIAAVISHDAAVAAAGITTVLDAVALGDTKDNSDRTRELDAMVRSVRTARMQGLLRSEHFLHLRCEVCYPDVLSLFTCFNDDPLVKLVSLMDHTPGQRQFTRMEKFLQYYKGKYTLNDAEMEDLVRSRKECQKKYSHTYREQILEICRQRGLPTASHDDTTPEHVGEAAAAGIILSEFPTTLQAARAAREAGLGILVGAPNLVLGRSHSDNVSALELARVGLLDILSSDYVPGSLLHGTFLLHHELGWSIPEALGVVSVNPARVARLEDRGCIEEGKRADLIQVKDYDRIPIIRGIWRAGRRVS